MQLCRQYLAMLRYFKETRTLHTYGKFTNSGAMPSTPNAKTLQPVFSADDGVHKLGRSNYYKYRARECTATKFRAPKADFSGIIFPTFVTFLTSLSRRT